MMTTAPKPTIPKHIAIIMDGNNRYAKKQGLPMGGGHIAGKDSLDPIVEFCLQKSVQVLTVFAFSSENWTRPKAEVDLLMELLEQTIYEQLPRMHQYQVRLRFIGDLQTLAPKLQKLIHDATEQTAHFNQMTLVIAIGYGGKWDIVQSAKTLAQQVKDNTIHPSDIDEERFASTLCLADVPPVDMLIRTGGEFRISNFLLWQIAYAELFFTPTLWPDFTPAELSDMLNEFALRERRFGQTSAQVQSLT